MPLRGVRFLQRCERRSLPLLFLPFDISLLRKITIGCILIRYQFCKKGGGGVPLFSLKKIGQLASTRQAYLRGVGGYNAGWVSNYTAATNAFYPEYVTADVTEKAECYRVEIGFDHTDTAEYLSCSCGAFHNEDGACKHIVAALVYKYYKDMIDGLSTAAQLAAKAQPTVTDPAARRLIDCYMTARTDVTFADEAEQKAVLTPILSLHGACPTLIFTVGTTRPYHIKNLPQFARRIAQNEVAEYGTQLTLRHQRDSFDAASLPLLDFLLGEMSDRQTQPTLGGAETLVLSPAGMDRFFVAMAGNVITLREAGEDTRVLLTDGDPPLTATIKRQGEGVRIEPAYAAYARGLHTVDVQQGSTLYRTSPDYSRRMTEWLDTCRRAAGGLYVSPADLGAFCAGVLATVKPHLTLDGDTDALTDYQPRELAVEIYLDAPEEACVTAEVTFVYGEDTVNAYTENSTLTRRDTLAEMRAKAAIQPHFTAIQPDTGRLVLRGDDDRLFDFITRGVDALRRVGAVYATDAFDSLAVAPPVRLSAGLSLSNDLLEMTLDIGDLPPIELDGIIRGYREKKRFHRLKSGRFIRLEDGALADLAAMADTLGLTKQELRTGHIHLPKYRALYLEQLLHRRAGIQLSRDEAVRSLSRRLREAGDTDYPVPDSLQGVLRGYQVTRYRWLRTMEDLGFCGILADEMGLGKTLQVITLMLAAKQRGAAHTPSLVVCPTSVVLGWEREIARFAPALRVLCVIGDAATRAELLSRATEYDVLVTSYDMLKRDIALYEPMTFHYHVLDEAQYIKNSTTQNARAVKLVRSRQRFALTGTPMENRLSELWSIFDFLVPGLLFSPAKFRTRFEQPILREGDSRALERLGQMVSPFILRRLKRDVLTELPKKTEQVLPATMDTAQRQVYLATLQELRGQLSGGGRLSGQSRMTVLAMLTRLRQICCDPRLCCEGYTGESCKLEACVELVRQATDGGHKVLLFSQFTSMLELLRHRLEKEGIAYYLLQGSTPKEERARLVEAFNSDDTPVFLISLKAGGTGLNLTGADMVIHYDPWWNLSVQNQATDRAYRIGQKNPVQVVRLIARDTVEERILRLQEDKWQLAESVVGTQTVSIERMSAEELLAILS